MPTRRLLRRDRAAASTRPFRGVDAPAQDLFAEALPRAGPLEPAGCPDLWPFFDGGLFDLSEGEEPLLPDDYADVFSDVEPPKIF